MKYLFSFLVLLSPLWASWQILEENSGMLQLKWQQSMGDGSKQKVERVIALPFNHNPSLQYKIIEKQLLTVPTESKKAEAFSPGVKKMGRFRDLELAGIYFNPLFQEGAKQYLLQKVEFNIFFNPQNLFSNSSRPSFPPAESHPSEQFLKSYLLNYSQSRKWRFVENSFSNPLAKTSVQEDITGERLVVRTSEEKIYTLGFEELKNAGLPLNNIDPRYIKLIFQGRQIPIYIHGENDGKFDKEDYIEFLGVRPEGSLLSNGTQSYNSFYTEDAVLYMSWNNSKYGLRAPLSPVPGAIAGVVQEEKEIKPLSHYPVKLHLEQDNKIIRLGGVAVADVLDLGNNVGSSSVSDFWFWDNQGPNEDAKDIAFQLNYSPVNKENSELGGDSARVTLRLQGITDVLTAPLDHHVKFLLNSNDISFINGRQNEALWSGTDAYIWTSDYFPSDLLKSGGNILTLQKINDLRTAEGGLVEVQDAYLDWIQIEFSSQLKAVGNYLRFNNNFPSEQGSTNFAIQNLTGNNFSLWDMEGRKLSGFNTISTGKTLQISFSDNQNSFTEYLLMQKEDFLTPGIYLDTIQNLKTSILQADYLIITQKKLLGTALDSLVNLREESGLSVQTVLADHIYANFGDGTANPSSIKSFINYAYHQWKRPAPIYVLLLGETTMLFDKTDAGRSQNIVPTHLIHIPGWGVTSNDDYYAKISGEDNIQDLWIGRIPVIDKPSLSIVIQKILNYEKERPNGHWQNKALLLGGFESIFTKNNNNLQSLLIDNNRQYSRWDVESNSPYYRSRGQGPSLFDMMDSAFNLVSFTGHGGGSVWSDAGMLTMDEIDRDSLRGEFAIPLITSFTCLTGFFEDTDYRSLGEEMLRYPKAGALSFYGASGYISSVAASLLSEQVFKQTLSGGIKTSGQIIASAENMVSLLTGLDFAPILGEFDLLGDPALPIEFPLATKALTVEGSPTASTPGLFVSDGNISLENPEAVISVIGNDSNYFSRALEISGDEYSESFQFRTNNSGNFPVIEEGKVISHMWDSKKSTVKYAAFNSLDWMLDSLVVKPNPLRLNSSVRIGFKLEKLDGEITLNGGSVSFYLGSAASTDFIPQKEVLLTQKSPGVFETLSAVPILDLSSNIKDPVLFYRIRMSLSVQSNNGSIIDLPGIQTKVYTAPIVLPSDLELGKNSFTIPVQNKLGIWVHFSNNGAGSDSAFKLQLNVLDNGVVQKTETKTYSQKLGSGASDSMFFDLKDGDLLKTLQFFISPSDSLLESNMLNNQKDSSFEIYTKNLNSESQRLYTKDSTMYIINRSGTAKRFFIEAKTQNSFALPEHLSPAEFEEANSGYYSISWNGSANTQYEIYSSQPSVLKKAALERAYWHYNLPPQSQWLKLDSLSGSLSGASLYVPGVYGMFYNQDKVLPKVQFSAQGQFLLQEDYIPQNSPLQITLKDDVGLDYYLHPPQIISGNREIDSTTTVNAPVGALAKSGVIQYEPKGKIQRDSLTVVAYDISGNRIEESLVYKKGQGLKIRLYGSYPNPFADSVIIVYQLTDWADKVSLKIYSRAGRLVKKLEEPAGTGYREIVWNGKDESGRPVSNGLYYLKVVASSGSENSSSLFKMFRMKRK